MKARTTLAASALALLLAGCGGGEESNLSQVAGNASAPPQLQQVPAPNNGDWTEVVETTPEGGYRMGNPDAPVKLVEFASMTCGVCARFSIDAEEPLRNYVRSGQVSWEIRNFILGAPDAAAAMLTRCHTPSAFFTVTDQLFHSQDEWLGRLDQNTLQMLQSLPEDQQLAGLARAMQLDTFFRIRGMPEQRFNQCLADRAGVMRLAEMQQQAQRDHQVAGTPTFLLNGAKLDVTAWEAVEQRIRAALP